MGGTSSKAAKTAGSAARQYPTRIPTNTTTKVKPANSPPPPGPGPNVHPPPQASSEKTEAIESDAFDPQLAAQLRSLGPVTPNPTQSNSSTFGPAPVQSSTGAPVFPNPASNPALQVIRARQELSEKAEREFEGLGRAGFPGREFLDVVQLRQVLMMRDQRKMGADEIEGRLGLKPGVVARLGKRGIVSEAGDGEAARDTGGALG